MHLLWAINSVGSECLPYKEEVGGSSPSLPTINKPTQLSGFYYFSLMYKSNFLLIILIVLSGCKKDELQDLDDQNNNNSDFFSEYDTKNFDIGFTSWPYAPTIESVDETYNFIASKYSPWSR